MTIPAKGKADYLQLGDWNAACYECGMKFKASEMRRNWQGFWTCLPHWTPRQPQDFVRATADVQTPAWIQPEGDTFVYFCTPNGTTGIAGYAVAGCAIPNFTAPGFDPAADNVA